MPKDLQKQRLNVIILSIVMGILILVVKTLAYLKTNSSALRSDAIESLVNVGAAGFAWFAVVFANKPADRGHPYGHGKIEFFSAAFEGGLISLAATLIIFEAVQDLWAGVRPHHLGLGLALNLGAGALNGVLGVILIRTGKQTQSQAIEADGHHVLSDFYTTVGIGIGLVAVMLTGWMWLDPVIAIVVGLLLARTGFRLVKSSSNALLDSEDPAMTAKIVDGLNSVRRSDIVALHELRTIRSGRYTHVDVHVVVPEFLEMREAHDVVETFGRDALRAGQIEGEFHSHIDPCRRLYCASCSKDPCAVRQLAFERLDPFTVESVTATGPEETID